MEMKHALLALLVFGYAFAGLAISDYVVSPTTVEPGGSGYITLTISNPSASDTVDLVTVEVSSAESLGANRKFAVGDLEQGASTILTVPFKSSETLASGVYTVEVKAKGTVQAYLYNQITGQYRTSTEVVEKIATIPISVVKKPILSVALSNENLEDMTAETITITNSGGKAMSVRMQLASPLTGAYVCTATQYTSCIAVTNPGAGFLNQDQIYFGTVEGSAEKPATIDARGVAEGANKLAIQVTYLDEIGNEYIEIKEIPVTVKKGEGDFNFVQQSPITTGKDETLTLTVTNSGDPVQDLQLTFSSDEVVLRGQNKVEFGDLATGESRTVSIPIVASLEPGTNNVQVSLSWAEKGENREGSLTIPLSVTSDSEVGVYLEANPTPLMSGMEHTLSVTVSNLGSYAIQGTTVEFSSEALTLLTVQPEQYIGGLDKDDFSSVQYKVRVNNVAAGNYNATVKVNYKDASGTQITEIKPVVISITALPAQGDGTTTLFIFVVAVAAVGYWYFRMRKKPKVKE